MSGNAELKKEVEFLESSTRKLLGDDLEGCSFQELDKLKNQIENSLTNIRARKQKMLSDQISELKIKETMLLNENAILQGKLKNKSSVPESERYTSTTEKINIDHLEVETELVIGQPRSR